VEYTINVTNHGPDTATNVNITDVLDTRLIFVSANGSPTRVGQTVNWTIASILNGDSYIISLIVQLNGTGNISNVANVTGSDQNNTGNNSSGDNNSTLNVTESINLSIVKTVNVSGVVLNGALVEYTINVTNHGPDTATNVNITDVLDTRLIFVSANGSPTRVGQTVNWTIASILNGDSYIISLIVQLNGTGNISNVANVTGSGQNNT
ncbi:DUF11 domain-containing protein, partial [Methanobrevibacter curvatus]|uniref:DUF11 domain-containing protein n=1 Tax=Methanobrevibacter curvatus TaxID=49547 RepID=UPI0012ECBE30